MLSTNTRLRYVHYQGDTCEKKKSHSHYCLMLSTDTERICVELFTLDLFRFPFTCNTAQPH